WKPMLLSKRISLRTLVEFCHLLRHNLDAGLSLVRIFQQQSERGRAEVRPMAGRILSVIKRGHSLESALEEEKDVLPPLFISLAAVGERTGTLPEVLAALQHYYETQLRLRRELVSRSMLPLMQLFAAILIIALLIWILGLIADSKSTKPL